MAEKQRNTKLKNIQQLSRVDFYGHVIPVATTLSPPAIAVVIFLLPYATAVKLSLSPSFRFAVAVLIFLLPHAATVTSLSPSFRPAVVLQSVLPWPPRWHEVLYCRKSFYASVKLTCRATTRHHIVVFFHRLNAVVRGNGVGPLAGFAGSRTSRAVSLAFAECNLSFPGRRHSFCCQPVGPLPNRTRGE